MISTTPSARVNWLSIVRLKVQKKPLKNKAQPIWEYKETREKLLKWTNREKRIITEVSLEEWTLEEDFEMHVSQISSLDILKPQNLGVSVGCYYK